MKLQPQLSATILMKSQRPMLHMNGLAITSRYFLFSLARGKSECFPTEPLGCGRSLHNYVTITLRVMSRIFQAA